MQAEPEMVSLAPIQTSVKPVEPIISPRTSFSTDLLDESEFISISLSSKETDRMLEKDSNSKSIRNMDFEFLSNNDSTSQSMITADELFLNGKLLPFWQVQAAEKLQQITLKAKDDEQDKDHHEEVAKEDQKRVTAWFIDDDPSPRPPKCTVLWKELLRLRKQRASTLSPSSSSTSSSTSSSSSSLDMSEKKESSDRKTEKQVKRAKKGLERTRSASIRIRPMVNVPICTQGGKSSALPPLFPLKKVRSEETRVRK